MYHYFVVNRLDETDIPLDSSRREGFNGYDTKEKAYMQGLAAKIENRLADYYIVFIKERSL